jgi:hypothetical protein
VLRTVNEFAGAGDLGVPVWLLLKLRIAGLSEPHVLGVLDSLYDMGLLTGPLPEHGYFRVRVMLTRHGRMLLDSWAASA